MSGLISFSIIDKKVGHRVVGAPYPIFLTSCPKLAKTLRNSQKTHFNPPRIQNSGRSGCSSANS